MAYSLWKFLRTTCARCLVATFIIPSVLFWPQAGIASCTSPEVKENIGHLSDLMIRLDERFSSLKVSEYLFDDTVRYKGEKIGRVLIRTNENGGMYDFGEMQPQIDDKSEWIVLLVNIQRRISFLVKNLNCKTATGIEVTNLVKDYRTILTKLNRTFFTQSESYLDTYHKIINDKDMEILDINSIFMSDISE